MTPFQIILVFLERILSTFLNFIVFAYCLRRRSRGNGRVVLGRSVPFCASSDVCLLSLLVSTVLNSFRRFRAVAGFINAASTCLQNAFLRLYVVQRYQH